MSTQPSLSLKTTSPLTEASLREKVKHYKKRAEEIEKYLKKYPYEWGRFQSEFNAEVNAVFREIMNFERENISRGNEEQVYKLKRLFINRIRKVFVRGEYIDWSLRKPHGYAGDFKIIEDIYENEPKTTGFDRLFDNYYQTSTISIAVRNRKNDFKQMLADFIKLKQNKNKSLYIMDLASGPCREIWELLTSNHDLLKNVIFDCYDNDELALKFASVRLSSRLKINFIKENAIRIAFRKNIFSLINHRYDIIYTTGFIDYLDEKIATRLIVNLRKLLNPEGIMIISDVRDKYSNPSVHFMEWVGDWNLVYRSDEKFREIFSSAGFKEKNLAFRYEQQGIMQYGIANVS